MTYQKWHFVQKKHTRCTKKIAEKKKSLFFFGKKLNIRVGKNSYVFLKKAYNSILCFGKREHGFVVLAK